MNDPGITMRQIIERATQVGSDYINATLASEFAQTADRGLRDIVDAKSSAISKAMDAEYLRTHIGGGMHRLFDDGHDLWGSFKAARSVTPEDNILKQLGSWSHELWKDLATPNGLPVITVDKATFDAVKAALQEHLNVPPAWVYDMATFTATELGGAIAALAAILVNLRTTDPERYLEMCGSLGVAAVLSANPLLVAVWAAMVLQMAYNGRRAIRWRGSFAMLRGALVSLTLLATISLLGPLGLILAIPVAVLVHQLLKRLTLGWSKQIGRSALIALRQEVRMLLAAPQPKAS
jgi:hypothetical protein